MAPKNCISDQAVWGRALEGFLCCILGKIRHFTSWTNRGTWQVVATWAHAKPWVGWPTDYSPVITSKYMYKLQEKNEKFALTCNSVWPDLYSSRHKGRINGYIYMTESWGVTFSEPASHPGGVAMLQADSCYRNWPVFRNDSSLKWIEINYLTPTTF